MNLLLLAISGVVAVGGDYLFKRFGEGGGPMPLLQGLLLYAVSMLAFAFSLRTGLLLTNGAVFVVLNGVGVILLSRFSFHEAVSVRQWAGLALAAIGVALMEL